MLRRDPHLPDRTGLLISPAIGVFSSTLFSALLVYKAFEIASGTYERTRYTSVRNEILGALVRGLAEMLGPIGSVGLSAVLIAATSAWLFVVVRRYRALVAEDRNKYAPPAAK